MKIKWRYPGDECFVEIVDKLRFSRLCCYLEIPPCEKSLADIFIEPAIGEIAFCVPIFFSTVRPPHIREISVMGYIKRAFWQAYEFARWTDLIETKTGFYIVVERSLRPLIEPYRQSCDFPENRILVVESQRHWRGYMPKIGLLKRASEMTHHQYYLNIDTNVHICEGRPHLCKELQEDWKQNPKKILTCTNPWKFADDDVLGMSGVQSEIASGQGNTDRLGLFYTEMPKFFGYDFYEHLLKKVLNPNVNFIGACYGIPRSHLDSNNFGEFYSFITQTPCLSNDESFMGFYWHRYLAPDQSYLEISESIKLDDIFFRFKSYDVRKDYVSDYEKINDDRDF